MSTPSPSEKHAVIQTPTGVELTPAGFDHWLLRLESVEVAPASAAVPAPPTAVALVSALAQQFPEVSRRVADAPAIRVVFSSETRRLLASGDYRLMRTSTGLAPTAVDAAGRIVETARLTSGAGAVTAGGVTAGAAIGLSWPLLVAGGLAAAAALAEQRWLEQTLGGLQTAIQRIEHRLRDDDAGTLEAALRLSELLQVSAAGWDPPAQLKLELAVARHEVERVYLSRRRFIGRFKQSLAEAQEEEGRTGQPNAGWRGGQGSGRSPEPVCSTSSSYSSRR